MICSLEHYGAHSCWLRFQFPSLSVDVVPSPMVVEAVHPRRPLLSTHTMAVQSLQWLIPSEAFLAVWLINQSFLVDTMFDSHMLWWHTLLTHWGVTGSAEGDITSSIRIAVPWSKKKSPLPTMRANGVPIISFSRTRAKYRQSVLVQAHVPSQ